MAVDLQGGMRWYVQDIEDKYTDSHKTITAHKQYRPGVLQKKMKQEMENIVIVFDMTSEYETISRLRK